MMADTTPVRIRTVELDGFKSFRERVTLNFGDADIVLLTGPNGAGKTSVVEALELAVTGEIQRRVGAPRDSQGLSTFRFSSAADCESAPAATAAVGWADGTSTRVGIDSKGRKTGSAWWEGEPAAHPPSLRAQTFLYSDSLGSILGMSEDARRRWLDAFLPKRERLAALDVSRLTEERDALLRRARDRLGRVHAAHAADLGAAGDLQRAAGGKLSLVKSGPDWHARPNLEKWLKELGVNVAPGLAPQREPHSTIEHWADALKRRADALEQTRIEDAKARSATLGAWAEVQRVLDGDVLRALPAVHAGEDLRARRASLRGDAEIEDAKARSATLGAWAEVQ
ncbi:MAG TPA: AAA family ATPase, partial [Myxococcota bacterium]|nr:AAA family ATPase [Myxococcota bacterium]